MDRLDAVALVNRIEQTWPERGGWRQTRVDSWTDALTDLDHGAAGTAFARLRATHDTCPSVAEFIRTTNSITTNSSSRSSSQHCTDCDNTGYVQAPDLHDPDLGHTYTQVTPCRCHPAYREEAA